MIIFPYGFTQAFCDIIAVLSARLLLFIRGCTGVCGGVEGREWDSNFGGTLLSGIL